MRGLVARVANHQPFGARRELAPAVGGDALLHEAARARGATFAIQRKNGEQGGIQRTLHVGIVEDQDGRLAAQFHRVLLDAAGASQDLLARDGAARERDRAHAGVPTPAGMPASSAMLPNWAAVNRDSSDIFSTAVLPSARHGAVFQVAVMNGTFQGDTSAHTPTGWYSV
ncbi:hypothetical protein G6F57_021008 [Rhizopus arrhizus]|nr:hypothetical protein G6F57_021008 [Rhizopus arrhizus]